MVLDDRVAPFAPTRSAHSLLAFTLYISYEMLAPVVEVVDDHRTLPLVLAFRIATSLVTCEVLVSNAALPRSRSTSTAFVCWWHHRTHHVVFAIASRLLFGVSGEEERARCVMRSKCSSSATTIYDCGMELMLFQRPSSPIALSYYSTACLSPRSEPRPLFL
ncbi:hypothetical protein AMTR_s04625p00006560 [Amborella trichopoda]|uniref:Uncharacterized protein n=1 Tax=Amborella trichopoda TaxID=13333 RepID=U5CTZ3_AMBTC|nr:hypothetical protein AMTR_s04625p00006560 [Amborella trichopoda]